MRWFSFNLLVSYEPTILKRWVPKFSYFINMYYSILSFVMSSTKRFNSNLQPFQSTYKVQVFIANSLVALFLAIIAHPKYNYLDSCLDYNIQSNVMVVLVSSSCFCSHVIQVLFCPSVRKANSLIFHLIVLALPPFRRRAPDSLFHLICCSVLPSESIR